MNKYGFKVIYEDNDVLVVDKPAGIIVFNEQQATRSKKQETRTLTDYLLEKYPKLGYVGRPQRYGVVHRLDKDTSGILLVAKNNESLKFLQNQFINREVEKKYTALATGRFKEDNGKIETLIGRSKGDPRKQKAYPLRNSKIQDTNYKQIPNSKQIQITKIKNSKTLREALTEYKVLQRFENYTLLEVAIKTGRKHQIRCHLAYIHHPIAGDKLYGFKDSPLPEGLKRQFLHASYVKIKLPGGKIKEFRSDLPEDLRKILKSKF